MFISIEVVKWVLKNNIEVKIVVSRDLLTFVIQVVGGVILRFVLSTLNTPKARLLGMPIAKNLLLNEGTTLQILSLTNCSPFSPRSICFVSRRS
jgi:hypothetical protein